MPLPSFYKRPTVRLVIGDENEDDDLPTMELPLELQGVEIMAGSHPSGMTRQFYEVCRLHRLAASVEVRPSTRYDFYPGDLLVSRPTYATTEITFRAVLLG